jgi:hypothetical protein
VKLTSHVHLVSRLRMRGDTPLLPHTSSNCGTYLCTRQVFMAWLSFKHRDNITFRGITHGASSYFVLTSSFAFPLQPMEHRELRKDTSLMGCSFQWGHSYETKFTHEGISMSVSLTGQYLRLTMCTVTKRLQRFASFYRPMLCADNTAFQM